LHGHDDRAVSSPLAAQGPALSRVGTVFDNSTPCCHNNNATFEELIKSMNALHDFCGTRKTVVDSFVDFSGYVYFFADLRPALFFTEGQHFLFNSVQVERYKGILQTTDYDCVIGTNPDAPAFQIFEGRHGQFDKTSLTLDHHVVTALRVKI
jgi:hypothetical protein